MKTKRWHYKFLFLALLLTGSAYGQTYERSRSVEKSFKAPPEAEIQIVNKYGDIHLIPWKKDSVKFEIQLSVSSNKESKIDKIFDYVDFEFRDTRYYIIAQTVFKGQNSFWSEVADMASMVFSGGTHTQIDYTVYFPEMNALKIENKFGSIYTTDHPGKVEFTLSNGDLKAHSFSGPVLIRLDFGSATIDQVNSATIGVNYGELYLENADELILETRSSKLFLTDIHVLQIDSKRDKYYVKQAGEVKGTAYFSNIGLDMVNKSVTLRSNYGDIKVQDVDEKFGKMEFSAENTSITLYTNRQRYYDIEVIRDEKTQMVFTSTLLTKSEMPLDAENKSFKLKCTAGTAGKPTVPVTIHAKAGKVFVMDK